MKHFLPLVFFILIVGVVLTIFKNSRIVAPSTPTPQPSFNPFPYKIPQIPDKRSYLTYLVGDSIVTALGLNDNGLREDLIKLYPGHEFVNYNYGFPSTNIESLPARVETSTTNLGTNYPSILSQGFDLIIIESFANNPLSQYPVADGLKKQTEILDKVFKEIIYVNPKAVIAVMTPIAPSIEFYARGVVALTQTQRNQWVSERMAYINNAIDYAKSRNIPLINVYEKSLNGKGDGDLKYINSSDYIHPSNAGIALINQTIADFIYQNNIFPH
jgi:lysophospholipase L1-like esterase